MERQDAPPGTSWHPLGDLPAEGRVTTAVVDGCSVALTHVLLDNASLGKISKEQLAGQLTVWQTSLVNPDFAEFARSCGATGISVRAAADVDDGMRQLFAAEGPALLHLHCDPELV